MAVNRIEFAQFGHFDSFDIIRSLTSMAHLKDHELPTPIMTGLKTMHYVDINVIKELTYYYRVRVWRGSESLVSEEVICTSVINVFIGSYTLPNTNTNATIDLMVPSEAKEGDYLCAILICRSDRSFTVPPDWSVILDAIQGPASTPGVQKNRIYVLKKHYNSEPTVSFTQIGGAASQAILYVLRGDVVAVHNVANGSLLNVTKSDSKNSILAICHSNNFGGTEETAMTSLSRLRELQSGYSDFKETYYHTGDPNSQYFYYLNAQYKLTDMSESISLSYQSVTSTHPTHYQSVVALEIAQPVNKNIDD